jgi:outer membrane protein assembly factor BamB
VTGTARRPAAVAVLGAVGILLAACTSSGGPPPSAATGSTPAAGTRAPSTAAPAPTDWPMHHGRPDHAGISTTMPATSGAPKVLAKLELDGAVYASPIVVDGSTIVATENDSVYAFDSAYHQVWKQRLGDPSPAQERPCGDIDPLGITGTPIYSAATGDVYLVAEHGGSVRHELIALAARSGKIAWRRPIDLPEADATVMQQRGALAITGGRVWVPFGALAGDCGNYKGRLVGVRLDGTGEPVKFDPSTRKQGGIWNPAGATVDAQGHLLVVSANGSSFPGDAYDHTNSVDELDASGKLIDSFAPTDWAQNNQGDVGLGSQGVALVGAKWAVLGGKSGPVYVLRQGHLGGIGGQVDVEEICQSFGGAAVDGDVVYLPCSDSGDVAVRIDRAGTLHVLWRAAGSIHGSPVVGGGRVWALDQSAGVLYSLDPKTGKGAARVGVGVSSRFATPAISGRDVLVPTLAGLTVVQTS